MTPPLTFRQLLARSTTPIGTFCGLGSIDVIELVCHAGFDFVVVDLQHGAFDLDGARHAIRAIEAAGVCPVVRLPAGGHTLIEPLLDAGYSALIAPMINTAAQARAFVQAASYPPRGLRSQSSCRASLRGGAGYRKHVGDQLVLLAMIEHIDAVNQCGSILGEQGIDGILIGPTDLTSSICESSGAAEKREQAIAHVKTTAQGHGSWMGIAAATIESARHFAADGFQFVVYSTDRRILQDGLTRTIDAWQAGAARG